MIVAFCCEQAIASKVASIKNGKENNVIGLIIGTKTLLLKIANHLSVEILFIGIEEMNPSHEIAVIYFMPVRGKINEELTFILSHFHF